uniref:Uncharacterized protein n=1 Tax=Anguilla anguilla TaxID=7936 RepID=A0A0E9U5X9_ANGAN
MADDSAFLTHRNTFFQSTCCP